MNHIDDHAFVLKSILAHGGDTDTNGIIAGAIVGALLDSDKIPEEYHDKVVNLKLKGEPQTRAYANVKTVDGWIEDTDNNWYTSTSHPAKIYARRHTSVDEGKEGSYFHMTGNKLTMMEKATGPMTKPIPPTGGSNAIMFAIIALLVVAVGAVAYYVAFARTAQKQIDAQDAEDANGGKGTTTTQ